MSLRSSARRFEECARLKPLLLRRSRAVLLPTVVGLLLLAAPASAITGTNDPTTLANAALRDPGLLTGAVFDVAATANATAVATENVAGFPEQGSDYLVLSSGNATLAPNASQVPFANVNNLGGTRGGAKNVVALRLDLSIPAGANCVSLKFRFFSEEYPQFVGQGFNDGFLAEMDPSGPWTMANHQITAPDNFAFMPGGAFVSINSAPMTAGNAAGTTYGGGTEALSASTAVTPGSHSLVLSVWDDGDTSYDSAAFVDDIRAFTAGTGGCAEGSVVTPVDTTAPDTTIIANPGATSGSATSFSFTADEAGSSFECRLDGGAWNPCPSPESLTGLSSGPHTFQVRATDAAGNADASPASHTWTVDSTEPETLLSGGPSGNTRDTFAAFGFTSDDPLATFECQLDAGPWAPCTDPKNYTALSDGSHTFAVRARNALGNADSTPATQSWIVDTTLPDTSISSGPFGHTGSTSAVFDFAADEAGSTFECRLDTGAWLACVPGKSYSSVPDGSHTFAVRATDPAGNVDPTPASRSWIVDSTPPETTITNGPAATSAISSPSFAFVADEAGATFECRLDGGSWTACTSRRDYTSLADGTHTFEVRSTDAQGNLDLSPAITAWTIDTLAPDAPVIELTSAPAPESNDPHPTITFTGEPGATYECRLDGGTWSPCQSPHQLTGLADGPHTIEIRQTDEAGNTSGTAQHSWNLDTTAPAAPAILSGPPASTTDTTAPFAIAGETNATVECRVDGGAWHVCAPSFDLRDLALGDHLLQIRQTDEAGNVSPVAERRWTVRRDVPADPQPVTPHGLTGTVGGVSRGGRLPNAVSEGGRIPTGCALHAGMITRCAVEVRVGGHVVGRGVTRFGSNGVPSGRVQVHLYPRMRARLARSHRIVRATFVFTAAVRGRRAPMVARRKVILAARNQWILPSDGLFASRSAKLRPHVRAYLRAIVPQVRSARAIRCIGHTDSLGTRADNQRLGLRRARAVCRQLRKLGVRAHLVAVSKGETRPRSTNATFNGRRSNRRVELYVRR